MTYSTACRCSACALERASNQKVERLKGLVCDREDTIIERDATIEQMKAERNDGWNSQDDLRLIEALTVTIERVKALIPKWQEDRAGYPLDDVRAPMAFLAVESCEKELTDALGPTP